jgi:hypothetical protein
MATGHQKPSCMVVDNLTTMLSESRSCAHCTMHTHATGHPLSGALVLTCRNYGSIILSLFPSARDAAVARIMYFRMKE